MPNSTYLPSTDHGLLGFASNMNAQLAIDPAAFGLSVQQQIDFQSHLSMYAGALNTLSNPYTTGKPYTHAKNFAKDQLLNGESGIRQLVNFIKGRPEITDDQRSALRLTIPKTERTPALPPTTRPVIVITNTVGRTVSFKLRDESDSDRRAKPENAAQATLMTCVGDAPPENIREWSLGTTLTETTNQRYTFPHDVVSGSTVWLLAFWQNPKGKPGPNSVAVSTVIGGGVEQTRA